MKLKIDWSDGREEVVEVNQGEGLCIAVSPDVGSVYLSHQRYLDYYNVKKTLYGVFTKVTPIDDSPGKWSRMLIQPTWPGMSTYFFIGYPCSVCGTVFKTPIEAEVCSQSPLPLPRFNVNDIIEGPRGARYVVKKVSTLPSSTGHHIEYGVRTVINGFLTFLPGTTKARRIGRVPPGTGRKSIREKFGL